MRALLRRCAWLAAAGLSAGCYTWPNLRSAGLPDVGHHADLGPDAVDVSSYPPEQKRNYETYARVCAGCHTLARSVNSPTRTRTYWRFHLARMRAHARARRGTAITKDERDAVLDFLEYDSRVRKTERREEFDKADEELKRRFDPILEKRLWENYQDE